MTPTKKTTDVADKLLVITVPELANRLGISRGAAYRAVQCGELPAIRVGRTWRVPVSRLTGLLDGHPAEPGRRE